MNRNDLGPMAVDRRDFLKFTGGGIAVFVALKDSTLITEAMEQQRGYPEDFNAYLRVAEDGRVTVLSGKIEMGQGVETSMAQMVAEDLRVSLDSIDMIMGDTDRCVWDAGTWGSLTTRVFGPALRAAAAKAREVLLELASERLGAPIAGMRTAFSRIASVWTERVKSLPVDVLMRIMLSLTSRAATSVSPSPLKSPVRLRPGSSLR